MSNFRRLTGPVAPFCAGTQEKRQPPTAKQDTGSASAPRVARKQVEGVMKNFMRGITLTAAMVVSGAAFAADLPRSPYYAPAAAPAAYNWRGVYVGANAGYEWGDITNNGASPSGLFGGGQLGYNWQFGQFVLGAETDIQGSGADDTFAPWKFSNPWFGTLRGRAGYALNNILFYATAGLAYGGITGEIAGLDESKTHIGWTGGLGMEVGFTPNWSAKVEYLYMDLSDRAYSITGANNGFEASMLRFGVNYHF
jgi:outer membrane immunogenic protein